MCVCVCCCNLYYKITHLISIFCCLDLCNKLYICNTRYMSQLTLEQSIMDESLFSFHHARSKKPAEAFQAKLYRLSKALMSHISPITDMLCANQFITSTLAWNIKTSHCTDYDKASKIVYELLRQLQVHKNPDEYLRRICDLFDSLNDPILRCITLDIMEESGCDPYLTCGNYIK